MGDVAAMKVGWVRGKRSRSGDRVARNRVVRALIFVAATLTLAGWLPTESGARAEPFRLAPCKLKGVAGAARCGTYPVFEDRSTQSGRRLNLRVVVLAAARPTNQAPIFFFPGGTGDAATDYAPVFSGRWELDEHDVVLIDQRGTGDGQRLDCRSDFASFADYLRPPYRRDTAQRCLSMLGKRADLSRYSTAAAVDDVEDVRRALGYARINIEARSSGTYAALTYMQRYPDVVRAAVLYSVLPPANRTPLYLAADAQAALDRIFADCGRETACRRAYPDLEGDFATVMRKLERWPVRVGVRDPWTGRTAGVDFGAAHFGEAIRQAMYAGGRDVPFFIHAARLEQYDTIAQRLYEASKRYYNGLNFGQQMSITCNEFANRIRPGEIAPQTAGTFLADLWVKGQIDACAVWPRTDVPATPDVQTVPVPTLLISGDVDPVMPARWGEEFRKLTPNSVHLIVPGGHTPSNPCTDQAAETLLATGSVAGVTQDCVAKLRPRPFTLPVPGMGVTKDGRTRTRRWRPK